MMSDGHRDTTASCGKGWQQQGAFQAKVLHFAMPAKGFHSSHPAPGETQAPAGSTQLGRKLGLLVDAELNMSQWCDLEANSVLGYGQQIKSPVARDGLSSTRETGTD